MSELMQEKEAENISARRFESLSHSSHLLGAALIVIIVATVSWAHFGVLNIVSIATGSIIPTTKVQQVQHLEGGIVESIEVREGDRVEAGQTLVVLSAVSSESDVTEIRQRIQSLQADVIRYEAEARGDKTLTFPETFQKAHPHLVTRAVDLFEARRASLKTDLALQKAEKRLRSEEMAEVRSRIRSSKERLKLVKEQIQIGEHLLRSALSNRYEQIERLKEANSLRSKIDEDKVVLLRGQIALAKAEDQLQKVQKDYDQQVQAHLAETRQQLEELQTRAEKFADNLDRTVLRAPVSGIVKRLYAVTEGGVIRAGDTVMDIVPEDDRLIVEAKLPPQDVGYVRVGLPAFVQLETADAARLGKIGGVVKHVSPDSLVTSEGQSFYIVHIEVERAYFGDDGNRVMLFPGMIVSAGIVLGERSVLEYMVSPFIQNAAYVMSEL